MTQSDPDREREPLFRYRPALAFTVLFETTFIAVKLFAVAVVVWRFRRPIGWRDLVATGSSDAVLVLLLLGAIAFFASASARGGAAARTFALALNAAIAIGMIYAILIYVVAAYVVWEWGAFLESHHMEAIFRSSILDEVRSFLLAPKGVFAAGCVVALIAGGIVLSRWLSTPARVRRVMVGAAGVAVVLACGFPVKLLSPALDLTTRSPLLETLKVGWTHSDGLPLSIPLPPAAPLVIPPAQPPRSEFRSLAGVAHDFNVIFLVLESVRRENVSLYGYRRRTTPSFDRLSDHSIIFDRAYVSQPRSCKAMESFTLGIIPDPRLRCMSWQAAGFHSEDNLLKRLADQGYELYYGSSQAQQGDNFGEFTNALAGGRMSRVMGAREFASAEATMSGDNVLVRDYLRWTRGKKKTAAILWLTAAHYPYQAPLVPFGTETDIDRYDNGIYSADLALRTLLHGLDQSGQRGRTILVAFGDHGELLGEHMERLHGTLLYEQSLRIPFIINAGVLPRIEIAKVVQLKDIPATLLYLLGLPEPMRQSVLGFSELEEDVYLSNVYHDFKLGVVKRDGRKFVWRPAADLLRLFDLRKDPEENHDAAGDLAPEVRESIRKELLTFYARQMRYLEKEFPGVISLNHE